MCGYNFSDYTEGKDGCMRFCWWPYTSIISGGNVGAQTGICDYFGGYAGEGSRTFWALKFW